jgi:hypothetical protein
LIALPSSAVQLFPAWSSSTSLRVKSERASIDHLSLGRKLRFRRRFPFRCRFGWMEPLLSR